MRVIRRLRIPAFFCALAVLACELVARPYASMAVCDDGPYILMARTLATTGHVVYNGWAAAMIIAQLYLGAAFIKLFGFSFTTVRMSGLLVSLLTAFLIQRTLVRAGIHERNATIGTLALVVSPLYLLLSPTFMSDLFGLFAVVLCLYGCLRALQAAADRSTILWLCFAVLSNAVFGTSRQIAWLGILVMLPSTLWLLRANRRVLFAGITINLAGAGFIVLCLQWLKHQPYIVPVPLLVKNFPFTAAIHQLTLLLSDIPFLLLPITASFIPGIRRLRPSVTVGVILLLLGYALLASYPSHLRGVFRAPFEPTSVDWVTERGIYVGSALHGYPAVFLPAWVRLLLTCATFAGLIGFAITCFSRRKAAPRIASIQSTATCVSWRQLLVLLTPFGLAYLLLLCTAVATTERIFDRYSVGLLVVVLLLAVRFYQERFPAGLSLLSVLLILVLAAYGVVVTYDNYSFYRARAALADELRNAGIPATSVDNGWEYNLEVELQNSNHINDPLIRVPANAHVPPAPLPAGTCSMHWYDRTPHIHPLYGVSFDPNACYGLAPFAPVHYSRWPYRSPGALYVVRYTQAPSP